MTGPAEQWKWISGILGSVLVTGLVSWFSFGGGLSRSETVNLIRERAPYIEDRKAITEKLRSIEARLDKNGATLDEIKKEMWKAKP